MPLFSKKPFTEQGVITPKQYLAYNAKTYEKVKNPPTKFVFVHYLHLLEYFKKKYKPKTIQVTRLLTIYQYKDMAFVGLIGVGSPNAVRLLEELIALGGKEFLNVGSAGGLDSSGVFLCEKALVDEGTTGQYMPKPKYTYPDDALTKRLQDALEKNNVAFTFAPTWTTDALYRETLSKVKKNKKQGIKTVEMEASALFAVAELRRVKMAACFVVSDVLGEDTTWEPDYHSKNVRDTLHSVVDVAVQTFLEKEKKLFTCKSSY